MAALVLDYMCNKSQSRGGFFLHLFLIVFHKLTES